MAMSELPNPYALRSVTCSFGDCTRAWAANMRCVAQDAAALGRRPGEDAGIVGEKHGGQVERVGDLEEVRRLVGSVAVDRACLRRGLVRHDRDRLTAEPGQRSDDGTAEG